MFAAVAWPLAEIVDESIVNTDSDSNAIDFLAETPVLATAELLTTWTAQVCRMGFCFCCVQRF